MNACQLANGTNRTARNNAGTLFSRLQKYAGASELAQNVMINAFVLVAFNEDEIFLRIFFAFADRFRNFLRFAKTYAYVSGFIADHYKRRKTEGTTAFYNFRNAVYRNNSVL